MCGYVAFFWPPSIWFIYIICPISYFDENILKHYRSDLGCSHWSWVARLLGIVHRFHRLARTAAFHHCLTVCFMFVQSSSVYALSLQSFHNRDHLNLVMNVSVNTELPKPSTYLKLPLPKQPAIFDHFRHLQQRTRLVKAVMPLPLDLLDSIGFHWPTLLTHDLSNGFGDHSTPGHPPAAGNTAFPARWKDPG